MKVSNIKCKLKHEISTMVICGGYIFEFSVDKDMKKIYIIREVAVGSGGAFVSNTNHQRVEN
jgi:hypothetical protein